MALKVNVNLKGARKRLDTGIKKTQYTLANQVRADSNLYAPKLSGDLRRYSQVTNDNKSIIWSVPYARRHYYNQFTNYTTLGTGPKWDQKAKGYHLSNWRKIAEGVIK